MAVEVRMSVIEAKKLDHDVHIACEVLRRMRDAGIPAIGKISVLGVTEGALTMTVEGMHRVYRWTPPTDDEL